MATSTISHTVTDGSGTSVGSGHIVEALLMPGSAFRSSDSSGIARRVTTTTNSSGAFSLALERQANIVSPSNTWWQVSILLPDSLGGPQVYAISVGSSSATLLASLVTPTADTGLLTYITQSAADARYSTVFGGIKNAADYGLTTSNTAAANKTALDAAIAAVTAGGVVFIPEGDYTCNALAAVSKSVTLMGVGISTTASSAYGHANWGASSTRHQGSILRFANTSGNAIEASVATSKPFNLVNIGIFGPGSGTSIGVYTTATRSTWQNVLVANFAVGVKRYGAMDGSTRDLKVFACDTGLFSDNAANQNVDVNLNVSYCTTYGVRNSSGTLHQVFGGVMQGNTGTVVLHDGAGAAGALYQGVYFENSGATRAVDFATGDYNRLDTCHFGTVADLVRFGSNQNSCLYPQSMQEITLTGARNICIGQFATITNSGTNNVTLDTHDFFWVRGLAIAVNSGAIVNLDGANGGSSANWIKRLSANGETQISAGNNVVALATAAHAFRTGSGVTGSRPAAATAGAGGFWFDTTLGKPIFSTGSAWVLADGTAA